MIKLFISFILFHLVEFKKNFRIKNIRLKILKKLDYYYKSINGL